MACITISGYPCSGKTRRATQLQRFLEERLSAPDYEGPRLNVSVLSDTELNVDRHAYDESRSEKPARAAFLTAMTRRLSKDTILILDGMNYIKGYRYQIYCAAREVGVRVCTVFVVATPDQCKEWNAGREEKDAYDSATIDALLMRYEEPNSMVRWDAPLFTVSWEDDDVPGEAVWQAVISGSKKPPNRATVSAAPPPADILHTLEHTTAALVSLIQSSLSSLASPDAGGSVTLLLPPDSRFSLVLPNRNVTSAELQRLKRQFVAAHKKAMSQSVVGRAEMDWSAGKIGQKFVDYLQENFGSS